ncbi:MAG: preprotein translocase subunit SecG [Candidatus Parcubacteria bacterium]|jgi:protein translocase SecG subunit|nr:preprotein translocase subunit SecG [Candidatus Parcubacteria bacterium]
MSIVSLIKIALIVLGVILALLVILQQGESGLSETFGGHSSFLTTRRGAEKWIFTATIIIGIIFVGLCLALLKIK